MGKIRLIRLDSPEQQEFYLSSSETVIGRGPVLGCDDKRVSRNHAIIKLSDGGVTLVANHTNPCFYKLQNQDTYAVLMKGQEKLLTFGDEFALLPESFRYRIKVKPDVDDLNNTTERVDADPAVSNGIANEVDKTPGDDTVTAVRSATRDDSILETVNGSEVGNSRDNELASPSADTTVTDASDATTPVASRKRNLPNWLTDVPPSTSAAKQLDKFTKRKLEKKAESHAVGKKLKTSDVNSVAKEDDTPSTERVSPVVTEPDDNSIEAETAAVTVSNLHELSDDNVTSKDVNDEVEAETAAGTVSSLHELSDDDVTSKDGYEAEYGDADRRVPTVDTGSTATAAASNQGSSTSRETCMYGKDCYRKNPQHRVDFSHPGDSDFKVAGDDDDDADDDRPECEYGTSCYRKNVQHRKDFKHTQPWKRPRPPPQPTTAARDGESSEDDYDLEDPFINDEGSSDEYRPTSSSSSESESNNDNGDTDYQDSPEKKKKQKRKRREKM